MDIIDRFKRQADRAMDFLKEEGVVSEEDVRGGERIVREEEEIMEGEGSVDNGSTKANSLSNSNLSQQQQHQNSNPYTVKHSPSQKLPTLSKCIICHKKSNYRCPQCLISYCSSAHYKSHNLFCSEQFYKKQVINQMKQMRSTDQQRQQMREILKENNEQKEKDDVLNKMSQISEERLIGLLEMIEEGEKDGRQIEERQLGLTNQEISKLQEYIQNLQLEAQQSQEKKLESKQESSFIKQSSNQQNPSQNPQNLAFSSTPYWLIPDGLDYYFLQELQIEQFSTSENMDTIVKREFLSKRYRQEVKDIKDLLKGNVSVYVANDVLQLTVIYVGIALGWDGDLLSNRNEIFNVFDSLYTDNLPQSLSQQKLTQLQSAEHTFALIKHNISQLACKQTQQLLTTWYENNQIISSSKLIVKNKFLLIETFLRMLEFFELFEKDLLNNKEEKKNAINNTSTLQKKQKKKLLIKINKYIKKIEFLLAYIKDEINKNHKKTEQDSTEKKNSLLLELKEEQFSHPKVDLFRGLYRSLCNEEAFILKQGKQRTLFDQLKHQVDQKSKQGVLFY